jgi:hypothetical protein
VGYTFHFNLPGLLSPSVHTVFPRPWLDPPAVSWVLHKYRSAGVLPCPGHFGKKKPLSHWCHVESASFPDCQYHSSWPGRSNWGQAFFSKPGKLQATSSGCCLAMILTTDHKGIYNLEMGDGSGPCWGTC